MYVALVQTATSLPVFFFGLPAGALADLLDRRRLLLLTQGWMLVCAAILAVTTLGGWTGPWLLLFLTFALGCGSTLNGPAWQSIIGELVPRDELTNAIALNSMGFNMARAVGPALSGMLLAIASPGIAFLLNAISFVGVMIVLWRWKRTPKTSVAPTDRLFGAMRTGFRYLQHAPELQHILVRVMTFVLGASGLWAVLPLLAKLELGSGAAGYGVLLGCLGAGSVIGAIFLPRMRSVLSTDRQVAGATIVFAIASLAAGLVQDFAVVALFLIAAGVAWLGAMSSFNISVQTVVPDWIRARALGFYMLIMQAAMALGGVLWGEAAERWGVRSSLIAAGVLLFLGLAAGIRYRLVETRHLDLTPVMMQAADSHGAIEVSPHEGPVMVMIEYRIDPDRRQLFERAMQQVRRVRRRDGAIRWGLFHDPEIPGRCAEVFLVDSWQEHLLQLERVTHEDRAVMEAARAFHSASGPLRVTHWVAKDNGAG